LFAQIFYRRQVLGDIFKSSLQATHNITATSGLDFVTMNNDEKKRKFTIVLETEKVSVENFGISRLKSVRKMKSVYIEKESQAEIGLEAPLHEM